MSSPTPPGAHAPDLVPLHLVAELAPALMWMCGPEGGRVWSNRSWLAFVGRTAEEERGEGWAEGVHPADRARCLTGYRAAFQDRKPFFMDYRLRRHDGTYRWMMATAAPLFEQARFLGFAGSCTDITERKEAEERLRLVTDSGKLGAWDWDIVTDRITWTDAVYSIHGVERGSFVPSFEGYAQLIHPDDRALVQGHIKATLERDEPYDLEFRVTGHDGRARWVYTNAVVLREEGRPLRMIGSTMDITERKEMELALRERDERFRLFMEHLPGHAWIKDAEGRYIYINDGVVGLLGGTRGDILGHTDKDLFPADVAARHRASDERVRVSGHNVEMLDFLDQDDGMHHSLVNKFLIPDPMGGPALLGGISIDISDRYRAEEARREAQARFELLADNMDQLAWMAHADGSTVWFNKRWAEFSGIPLNELRARAATELHHPDHVERVRGSLLAAVAKGANWECTFPLKDRHGEWRWFLSRAMPVRNEAGEVTRWFGTSTDITTQRQAEDVLRESEHRFHLLADHMAQLVWTSDANGKVTWFNRRFYDFSGLTPEQVAEDGGLRVVHPDHIERVMTVRQQAHAQGEAWETTLPLRGADGTYRWFLLRSVPVRDEHGTLISWFGTNTDITDQKAAEDQLKEADRRKDEFLATLAHELRNPLAPLRTGLSLLRMDMEAAGTDDSTWQLMDRQLDHLVRLIDDLMDMSRINRGTITLQKGPVELNDVVELALNAVRPALEQHRHQLALHLHPRPVVVQGDTVRLTQVLSNLLHNAIKYTNDGGFLQLHLELQENEAVITVVDDGMGIPPRMLPHVFDMFTQVDRTLERSKGGLGIGLNIVHRLVSMHGGRVAASSAGEERGSTFTVHLPLLHQQDTSTSGPQARPSVVGPLHILIVDDNRDAADSLALLLRKQGHRTTVAYDGLTALELADADPPQAVFLDIGMPGMDGYITCSHMRDRAWGRVARIWAVTGLGQEGDRRRAEQAGFDAHFVKPLDTRRLAEVLARVTTQRSSEHATT